ncbi:hypothetical protein BGX27_008862 [Mortierella sp. AM989]|nr:hypothetical protein BGX27_008862 [Mortierella sp. AM989]
MLKQQQSSVTPSGQYPTLSSTSKLASSRSPQLQVNEDNNTIPLASAPSSPRHPHLTTSSPSSSLRQPQLTAGYTPPPIFSSASTDFQNTLSPIHYSHGQPQEHPHQLEETDYEIKGEGTYAINGPPLPTHDPIPYPVPQDSHSWALPPSSSIGQDQQTQSQTWQYKEQQHHHSNATTVSSTPSDAHYKTEGRYSRNRRLIFIIFCIVVIGVGIGVGFAVSGRKGNDSSNKDDTVNNFTTSIPGSTVTTTTARAVGTGTGTTTKTTSSTTTSTTTSTDAPTPTEGGGGGISIPPPPMPSLPPKGQCPSFICIDQDEDCQKVCTPDEGYQKCAKPCNGEFIINHPMAAYTVNIQTALSSAEISAEITKDDGEFVGNLFDTILYERAYYRLYELKKYDFPLRYDELAHDFLIAYRLCLEPKFLSNRHTAAFAHFILHSKLVTAKGLRKWVKDHLGQYELFPADNGLYLDGDGDDVVELNDDDFSDYDEVDQGMAPIRKNVGYRGPLLTRRTTSYHNGPSSEGQGHRDGMANSYFAVYKHSQDMIAVIIAHLRKRLWHHNGSGGEIVDIENMGVDGKLGQNDMTGLANQPVPNVKGVKKYTRRFNGRQKRANYDKLKQRAAANLSVGLFNPNQEPPTDYSDSDADEKGNGNSVDLLSSGVDAVIEEMARISIDTYTGSPKRRIHWLPLKHEVLYDSSGANKELRLIDLPTEESDPTFYGRLTRDLLTKYKELQPPKELLEKHKKLKGILENIISTTFPGEDFKVEPYGSFVSGLLMGNSDADFCITGPSIHDHEQLNSMHYLADILKSRGKMQDVVAIPDAMVPIVKFLEPQTQMECDLNTGNNLGVINSELIRIYTTLDERVKPFLFMIKAICKAQGINDSKNGYLSSYAITWMGIVFLQQEGAYASSTWGWGAKPVLPKLQQQPFQRMKEVTLRLNHNTKNIVTSVTSLVNSNRSDMVHCRYDDNKDGKHTGSGHVNNKSLSRLMIEFFEFFSRRFNYIEIAIHSGRGLILPKTNKETHHENQRMPTFRVVDPFLHHRNITGTCRGDSLARVWRAFDHSYRMLSAGDLEGAMTVVE